MKTCRKSKLVLGVCLAVLAVLLTTGARNAAADASNFCLTVPNPPISGFTGPYVCVDVNRTDSTHATITFTSQTVGGYLFLMGDGSTVALNVNATSFTVGAVGESNSLGGVFSATWDSTKIAAGQQVDGFGTFNLTITNFDGFHDTATSVSFELTNTSGNWASWSDVLTPNSGGSTAAAHIFVYSCTDPDSGKIVACATGFAADGGQVPEPASLTLLGTGLLGLGTMLRKRLGKK